MLPRPHLHQGVSLLLPFLGRLRIEDSLAEGRPPDLDPGDLGDPGDLREEPALSGESFVSVSYSPLGLPSSNCSMEERTPNPQRHYSSQETQESQGDALTQPWVPQQPQPQQQQLEHHHRYHQFRPPQYMDLSLGVQQNGECAESAITQPHHDF